MEFNGIKISAHAMERADRLSECLCALGMGRTVLEVSEYLNAKKRTYRLTSTGILFVFAYNGDTECLLTGFMVTEKRCLKLYYMAGYDHVPPSVYHTVVKNRQKFPYLLKL